MGARKSAVVGLTVLAYVVVSFAVQGGSHFAINAEHYAAIPVFRDEPMVAMGLASMVIQGMIFALLFPLLDGGRPAVWKGLVLSWAVGGFLASYIVLGEAGKYAIPSLSSWVVTELSVAAVQYTAFGVVLGLIHSALRSEAVLQGAA